MSATTKASKAKGEKRAARGTGGTGYDKTLGRYYAVLPSLEPGKRGRRLYSDKKIDGGTQKQAIAKRDQALVDRAMKIERGELDAFGRPIETALGASVALELNWDTLAEWGEYYLKYLLAPRVARGEVSPITERNYTWNWREVIKPDLGDLALGAARRSVIERWYNALAARVSDSTARTAKQVLGTILQAAVDREEETGLGFNGAAAFKLGKKAPTKKPEKSDTVTRDILGAAVDDRHQLVLDLGWRLGLRREEIAGLQWRDFDLSSGWLTLARVAQRLTGQGVVVREHLKTKPSDLKPIDPAIWGPLLQQHRVRTLEFAALHARKWTGTKATEPSAWLFPTIRGQAPDPQYIYNAFKALARKAGHGDRWLHTLRHDFVNANYEAGLDSRQTALLVGHASSMVTESVYGKARPVYAKQISGAADRWIDGLDPLTPDAVASS